ncbi:MAG: D-alanyl-D-alanine carboxypeptidase, partial [Methylocystis sp.]|nr:D-alanyl-D-alanine carboxypeptidase [Methylocystis sp.]
LDMVRQGKTSLATLLTISPAAAAEPPSKMGFKAGSEVTLNNALIMLMVKSANDIAVAIAEGVSGSVDAFADEMNAASARLGMRESYWVNPNGLPDRRQVTSARDLAILGRALYAQFPEYAGLFNIGAMQIGAKITPTHNGLLGRYPGADGMKTGFTCAAGFNLVASATRGGQRLIAVVLGAPSAAARTAKAASLLDRAFQTGTPIASLASLPSAGPTAAPDMRDLVCRNRGQANAEFMAEVEDVSVPIGSGSGIPLLDALTGAQQQVSVKEIAHLPRPHFTPVQVYLGRAPGYVGPVARARAPGAPIGQQTDLAAYAEEKQQGEGASPISRAAPDAASMRRGKKGKRGAALTPEETAPAEAATQNKRDATAAVEPTAPKAAKEKSAAANKMSVIKPPSAKSAKAPAPKAKAQASNGRRKT